MAQRRLVSFSGTEMPRQFSYRPYIPPKRRTVTRTNGAVVTQSSSPEIVHGDGTISWTIEGGGPDDFKTLFDFYNQGPLTLHQFLGYWGEDYQVYFTALDEPPVKGRVFTISGMFQVVTVATLYNDIACVYPSS